MTLFNILISLPTALAIIGLIWASWDEEISFMLDAVAKLSSSLKSRNAIEVSFGEDAPVPATVPSLPSDPSWPTPSWLDNMDDIIFVTRTKVVPAVGKAAVFALALVDFRS